MGTVRFSGELQDDILKNAKAIFADELKKASENYGKDWADKIYNTMYSQDLQKKMSVLPDCAFNSQEGITLNGWNNAPKEEMFSGDGGTHGVWTTPRSGSVKLYFSRPKRWVANFQEKDSGFELRYGDGKPDYTDSRWDWLKPEWKAYAKGVYDVTAKRQVFTDGVQNIMQQFTTLAPALKVFPALWDLVPEEAKERHKRIKEKVVKEVDTSNLDLKRMTATVTFNKLRG